MADVRRAVRVCIVGCGAVGSLFAANLATLPELEVWAYDLDRDHVEAINRDGLRLTGAGEVVGKVSATTDAAELPPCDVRDRRHQGDAHRERDRRRPRTRSPTAASRRVQNGIGNEEVLARHCRARDPRHDLPGREADRARRRPVGREGRDDARAVRGPARRRAPRSSGSPRPARRAGMPTARGRGRTRPAVAQGDLQRRHQPARGAHRAHPRPGLRAAAAAARSPRSSSRRARPSPRRRGSCSTPTPRR